uniref:Uncharacterized protein n=1 Tax=Neolamprologus brichardi TaxID=32507 RepID=A0A3Q4MKX4_NEOBR
MAVSVSRDLTVRVLEDPNTVKLAERQQALKNAIQKGEPKCLGVSFDLCVVVFVYVWIQNACVLISFPLPLHLYATSTLVAVIIYSVDMSKNPEEPCTKTDNRCDEKHYETRLSRGVKSSLLVFTLAQTVIAAILCVLLLRQRRSFVSYTVTPPTSSLLTSPDLN